MRRHVGYSVSYAHRRVKGIRKTKRTKLILQSSPSWEVTWRRHVTLIGRNKNACEDTTATLHTGHTRGSHTVTFTEHLKQNTAAKRLRMRQVEHFRSLFQSHFPVRSKSSARALLHSVCSLFSCSASCCSCFLLFCS